MKKSVKGACALFAAAGLIVGCYSVPDHIPEDLSSQQLIQLGQNAFEQGNIRAAELYYQTIIERFGGADTALRIEAMFEIAHFSVKRREWEKAADIFDEILALYQGTGAMSLPGAYRRLSEIDLAKIPPEKLAQARESRAERAPVPISEPPAAGMQATAPVSIPSQEELSGIYSPDAETGEPDSSNPVPDVLTPNEPPDSSAPAEAVGEPSAGTPSADAAETAPAEVSAPPADTVQE